jgi:hypothetical protein
MIFSALISAVLIFFIIVLKADPAVYAVALLGVVMVVGILVLYVLNVSKAACVVEPGSRILKVTGAQTRTIDLTQAACLETIAIKTGHVETRSLMFTDAEGGKIAVIPTYFTSKRGVLAEPMAKELAQALDLEFFENVPLWAYDKEAMKEHEIEVAKQQKEEAKARKEAKMAFRVEKMRKKMRETKKDNNQ